MKEDITVIIIDNGFGIHKTSFPGDDNSKSQSCLLLVCLGCHGGHGAEGLKQVWHPYPELPYETWHSH